MFKIKKFFSIVFLIFLAFCAFAEGPVVSLKEATVTVATDKIYLVDIADFFGFDEAMLAKAKGLYIKRAAMPGYTIIVTKEYVYNKMVKGFRGVSVEGPNQVEVLTGKKEIPSEAILKTALEYINSNMTWPKENVEITNGQLPPDLKLTDGTVTLRVREDNTIKYKGNVIVPVEVFVNGKSEKIQPVSLFMKVQADCLISTADFDRGMVISETAVKVEKKDITYMPEDIVTSASELGNMVTKRGVGKGTVLLRSMFEITPLFKRGDKVSVVVKIKSVSIEASGIAMADGRQGERVDVKLIGKKSVTVQGKVAPSGAVIIEK